MHDCLRARVAQVEHQAALAAVVPLEALAGSRHHAARAAEGIALGRLHLDHVGAEVGEELPDHRAGDDLAELEHADAIEGAVLPSRVILAAKRRRRQREDAAAIALAHSR